MKNIILLFSIITSFQINLNAQYLFYKGQIGKSPIKLILCNNDSHFTGLYYYEKDNMPIELQGNFKNGELTLYDVIIKHNWDYYKIIFEFPNFNLNDDNLIGDYRNIQSNEKFKVELIKTYSFKNWDESTFDSLELIQVESTKEEFIVLLLNKSSRDLAKFYGLRIYDKKNKDLKQQINLDESFDKVNFSRVEVKDYNSDGIEDILIKFYDNQGNGPWGHCFIKKDNKFIPFNDYKLNN